MDGGDISQAIIFIGAGLLIGLLIEYIIIGRIIIRMVGYKEGYRKIVLDSIDGAALVLCIGGGAYAAIRSLGLDSSLQGTLLLIVRISILITIFAVVLRLSTRGIEAYFEQRGGVLASSTIFLNVIRALILVVGTLTILQIAGVSITPLLTTLGVGGIAVALALQDTLSNFFSGVYIILSQKFQIGDYVMLESGEEGYITDITWSNTTIRTLTNNMLIAPNAQLTTSRIINYERPSPAFVMSIEVGVRYDSDLDHVEQVTLDVARSLIREMPAAVADFEPFIRYNAFADFRITFNVLLQVETFVSQWPIRHEFIKRLHRRYREEGIIIPVTTRSIEFANSEDSLLHQPEHSRSRDVDSSSETAS